MTAVRIDRANSPRRISRAISTTLIALAGILIAMWVLSWFRGDAANVYTEVMTSPSGGYTSHQRAVATSRGRLWFAYVRAERVEESGRHDRRLRVYYSAIPHDEEISRYDAPLWLARLGFDWRGKDNSRVDPREGLYVYREAFFSIPYWLIVLLCSGFGWWIGRRARVVRQRRRRGLCVACGYDVRATPSRCPECGHVPTNGQRDVAASASA